MQSATRKQEARATAGGVVYRTTCQNPGCGHTFDLRITAQNATMLGSMIECPRCRRHGGMLERKGRIGDKLFAAKLVFKLTGVYRPTMPSEEGDSFSEITGT